MGKKSIYRSKLKSAKGSQGRNNDESPAGSDMDGEGKSAMSCVDADIMGGNDSTEDVGVDKLLHNKDLFDMEDSDDEQSSKNKRCPEDEDKDSEEDESEGEGDGSNEAEVDIGEVRGKIKGGKSAAEKLRKESRSEQQRLL